MHRPDREVRRPHFGGLIVVAAVVASMLAPAAATAAQPPTHDGLAQGSRASGTGTRGPVDVSALPAAAVPTVAPTSPDLPSPFHGLSAGMADTTADTTDTTGPTDVVTTTAPPAKQPGWAGMRYADTGLQRPDPSVAAGPDHVVQVVNASVKMWHRSGEVLKRPDRDRGQRALRPPAGVRERPAADLLRCPPRSLGHERAELDLRGVGRRYRAERLRRLPRLAHRRPDRHLGTATSSTTRASCRITRRSGPPPTSSPQDPASFP